MNKEEFTGPQDFLLLHISSLKRVPKVQWIQTLSACIKLLLQNKSNSWSNFSLVGFARGQIYVATFTKKTLKIHAKTLTNFVQTLAWFSLATLTKGAD